MQSFYESFFETRVGCPISTVVGDSLPPQFRLRGAYRKIVQKANNLKWEIYNSVRDTQVLIKSDVDRLRAAAGEEESIASATEATGEKTSKAVVFECDLNSGVYLTMAIREVTSVVDT
jgi:tRNA(Glu) U13 pseudouridine synthase TruD